MNGKHVEPNHTFKRNAPEICILKKERERQHFLIVYSENKAHKKERGKKRTVN